MTRRSKQQRPVSRPPILKCRLDSPVLILGLLLCMRMQKTLMASIVPSLRLFSFICSVDFASCCTIVHCYFSFFHFFLLGINTELKIIGKIV